MPIAGSANVAAIHIPTMAPKDLALLDRSRVNDSTDEGIVDNGPLVNEETGDVGMPMAGGTTYGPVEDGAGARCGSLVERHGWVVAQ